MKRVYRKEKQQRIYWTMGTWAQLRVISITPRQEEKTPVLVYIASYHTKKWPKPWVLPCLVKGKHTINCIYVPTQIVDVWKKRDYESFSRICFILCVLCDMLETHSISIKQPLTSTWDLRPLFCFADRTDETWLHSKRATGPKQLNEWRLKAYTTRLLRPLRDIRMIVGI